METINLGLDRLWEDVDCAVQTSRYIIKELKEKEKQADHSTVISGLKSLINDMETLRNSLYELREQIEEEEACLNDIEDFEEGIERNERCN